MLRQVYVGWKDGNLCIRTNKGNLEGLTLKEALQIACRIIQRVWERRL